MAWNSTRREFFGDFCIFIWDLAEFEVNFLNLAVNFGLCCDFFVRIF